MKGKKKRGWLMLFWVGFLCGCAAPAAKTPSYSPGTSPPPLEKKATFPVFELPIPPEQKAQDYLGVYGTGSFKIAQIKTQVLIIEAFSMYCPHCQRAAPRVNELYQAIEGRPDLQNKIKVIGIGVGNSSYEVDLFRNKYGVPFPLFPDQDISIGKMLGVTATPTFIGVKSNEDGTQQNFYFKSGGFRDAPQFLAEILKSSGVE